MSSRLPLATALLAILLTWCLSPMPLSPMSLAADVRKQTYTYKKVGPLEIKADVYRPDADGPSPVLVWVHGGALINGNREGIDTRLKDAMLKEGYVVVSLDYRLAPETQLPQIVADLEDGLRLGTRSRAGTVRGHSDRVAIAGGSAGGI